MTLVTKSRYVDGAFVFFTRGKNTYQLA